MRHSYRKPGIALTRLWLSVELHRAAPATRKVRREAGNTMRSSGQTTSGLSILKMGVTEPAKVQIIVRRTESLRIQQPVISDWTDDQRRECPRKRPGRPGRFSRPQRAIGPELPVRKPLEMIAYTAHISCVQCNPESVFPRDRKKSGLARGTMVREQAGKANTYPAATFCLFFQQPLNAVRKPRRGPLPPFCRCAGLPRSGPG